MTLSSGTRVDSLSAATTGTGTAYSVPIKAEHLTVIVEGTGTLSAGVISIEEAGAEDYSGTWSVITTVTATNITGGAVQVLHIFGLSRAIRARVSTTVTGGGTVTAGIVCN